MRDRNNPLKNIPSHAFTIIQASHAEFHKDLADIPVRYPEGRITWINNQRFIPLLKFRDEHLDRVDSRIIPDLAGLLSTIRTDTAAILLIEYQLTWFGIDKPEEMLMFNEVCRKRAQQGGPVVLVTAVMDRSLLALDGKADYFFQLGKIPIRGRRLALKEQTYLDDLPAVTLGISEPGPIFGQTKIADW